MRNMDYWNNLAKAYNATLFSDKEITTADTSPVQKSRRELSWSNSLGDVTFKYFHSEHALSHDNSTYSELKIRLSSKTDLTFKLTKLDFLERIYAKIWYRKNAIIIKDFLLKSNRPTKAKRIIKSSHLDKLYIQSIELIHRNTESEAVLISREDFIRQQNADLYIELLMKIAAQISII